MWIGAIDPTASSATCAIRSANLICAGHGFCTRCIARPFIYDPSAGIADVEAFRVQVARADRAAKIDRSIQGIEFTDVGTKLQVPVRIAGRVQSEIERMGTEPGVLGRDVQGNQVRAMLVQQQAGLLELAPILGNFDDYILRVYRQMWYARAAVWHAAVFVRITDDAGAPKFINTREPELDARSTSRCWNMSSIRRRVRWRSIRAR